MTKLLSREKFEEVVLERFHGQCCFCSKPAIDAHHIFDRKLYEDGGYYEENGAPVCEKHHWDCETTKITVGEVQQANFITFLLIPPQLDPALVYDKWGNQVVSEFHRRPGPLADDTGCLRALRLGGFIGYLYS